MKKIHRDPLDILFSKYIHLRDKNTCQRCGNKNAQRYDAAHFIGRRNRQVRWNPWNACLLCYGCHSYLDGHPLEKIDFFSEKLGKQAFDNLKLQSLKTWPKPNKKAIEIWLKEKIKRLEKAND